MNLKRESRGDDVRMLQVHLAAHGFAPGAVDGHFGAKTEDAVKAFQRARGLVVDGVVGPKTWNEVVKPPALVSAYPVTRCYPLRALVDGRIPTITSRHAIHNPSRPNHRGVDFFYKRLATDPAMKVGDGGREKNWWIPPGTLVIAPAAGTVEIAGNSKTGWRVWVRHESGLATGGFHLRDVRVAIGDVVELGQDLGECGDNPADHDSVHLHWEVYRGALGKYPLGSIDPEIWLHGASILAAR